MINKQTVFFFLLVISCIPSFGLLTSFFESFSFGIFRVYIRDVFLSFCYFMLLALLWRNKYTLPLSAILAFFWIVNCSISVTFYHLFYAGLNEELAITLLTTNLNEMKGFLSLYWYLAVIFAFIFIFLIYCINRASTLFSVKSLIIMSVIIILAFSYKNIESIWKGKLKEPDFSLVEKTFPYLSLNNYSIIARAYLDLSVLKVSQSKPIYNLDIENTGIDTYVLLLGESARRDHVSLYGYQRDTSPKINQQKDNLFIFEQAISAAPITTMALTTALTIKPVESKDYSLLSYNIVNLANAAGYKTYWFSKQGIIGQYNSSITGIAQNASVAQWIDNGFDEALLPKLDEALADSDTNQKKLIILHINGSHFVACDQYPKEASYFKNGGSVSEDCYDNSIRYTDQLIGEILDKLSTKSASLMYFSDHGQIKRIKGGEIDYFHGSINPSKEAVEVPQFIWFNPNLSPENRKIGLYSSPYSTRNNYSLIANWLGIKKINNEIVLSPLIEGFEPNNEKIMIMDTRSNIFDYNDLPSDKLVH